MTHNTGHRHPVRRLATPVLLLALLAAACGPAATPPVSTATPPAASPASAIAVPPAEPAPSPTAVRAESAPDQPRFGEPRPLVDLPPSAGTECRLSPDGRWVSYVEWPERARGGAPRSGRLVAREIETGQVVVLIEGRYVHRHAWLPDSQSVVAIAERQQEQEAEILHGTITAGPVTFLASSLDGAVGFEDLAVSPDGRSLAFTVMYDTASAPVPRIGIDVMNVAGEERRQIVEPDFFVGDPVWSPDGHQVAYFKGKGGTPPDDGESYVVDAEGASGPRELLPRARLLGWSPEGRRALYESYPMDPRGNVDLLVAGWPEPGEPRVLVRGASGSGAAWVGDTGWIAYTRSGAIYLVSPAGGEPVRIAPEGERAGAPVCLPGQGIAYQAGTGALPSLRLLPWRD